jgi:hypothetical protein
VENFSSEILNSIVISYLVVLDLDLEAVFRILDLDSAAVLRILLALKLVAFLMEVFAA